MKRSGRLRGTRLLYGGSVTSQNASHFLQHKKVDGLLVGGASLRAEEFRKIIAGCRVAGKRVVE